MENPALQDTHAAFEKRYTDNTKYEGQGLELKVHMPCPFCAASDFVVYRLTDIHVALAEPHSCRECERSMKMLSCQDGHGGYTLKMIQTAGAPPPPFLAAIFTQEGGR